MAQIEHTLDLAQATPYEPFGNTAQTNPGHSNHSAQINPYVQESNGYGRSAYFQGQSNYTQPVGFLFAIELRHVC